MPAYGTREFEEMRAVFERIVRKIPGWNGRLDREDRGNGVPPSVFYQDGQTDLAFQVFMHGWEARGCVARMEL